MSNGGLPKSVYYYESKKDDTQVIEKLQELVEKAYEGYPYYFNRIRNEGLAWNHKRVKRVYNKLKLNKRRKFLYRLPHRYKEPLIAPQISNNTWSIVCMIRVNGRKVRILNIIDDRNRQALCIEADYSHLKG
ncbi:MAG: hypothetical protein U0T81_08890 [Saprospiraceae bacterium]